ncbi:MAG: class I SAM-dependent methyltransferase [Candidatus Zixiibacteriota bacterium]|nr:MAG: class I SAM-dependent methyltransferase [candidate division Zixibacteria bacterium]
MPQPADEPGKEKLNAMPDFPGDDSPIALNAYEELAERYAAQIDTKAENAYYERPATLTLLPDVKGMRVLDAGCGPGSYSEWLISHGAEVTAVDVSPTMVEYARRRLGPNVAVWLKDLSKPLDFLDTASFDLVLCALVLDYIRDWGRLFQQFYRILRNSGLLVFSVGHPFTDFLHSKRPDYYATETVEATWTSFGIPVVVPYMRRPLQEMIDSIVNSGFAVEKVLEPEPSEELKRKCPRIRKGLSKLPKFICFRASKIQKVTSISEAAME